MKVVTPNLLDCLKVCYDLPESEQRQIKAFGAGDEDYDPEQQAVALYNMPDIFKFCAVDDADEALAVGGYVRQRQGVYRSYMLATNKAWAEHGKPLTLLVRRVMRDLLKEHAHRLETLALASRLDACKWYEAIGMRREGRLKAYGVNGEDAVIYAKWKHPQGAENVRP